MPITLLLLFIFLCVWKNQLINITFSFCFQDDYAFRNVPGNPFSFMRGHPKAEDKSSSKYQGTSGQGKNKQIFLIFCIKV